jgi:hypothetical protein
MSEGTASSRNQAPPQPPPVGAPGGTSVGTASENIDWLAAVRGRLGWVFDNVLCNRRCGLD